MILHGHKSCGDHMAWFGAQFVDAGFNVVLYDARAHGRSEGDVCGFGLFEVEDARTVARAVADRGAGPVVLFGMSMGAAVGIQALAGNSPFVGGVVVSPFSDLDSKVDATSLPRLVRISDLKPVVRERIRGLLGVDPREVSPLIAAENIRVPMMIVHGVQGETIPVEHGRMVFDAIPESAKQLLILPEAGHDDVFKNSRPWGPETFGTAIQFLRFAAGNGQVSS